MPNDRPAPVVRVAETTICERCKFKFTGQLCPRCGYENPLLPLPQDNDKIREVGP